MLASACGCRAHRPAYGLAGIAGRTVLEVLQDLSSAQVPLQWLLQIVPRLQPRYFLNSVLSGSAPGAGPHLGGSGRLPDPPPAAQAGGLQCLAGRAPAWRAGCKGERLIQLSGPRLTSLSPASSFQRAFNASNPMQGPFSRHRPGCSFLLICHALQAPDSRPHCKCLANDMN